MKKTFACALSALALTVVTAPAFAGGMADFKSKMAEQLQKKAAEMAAKKAAQQQQQPDRAPASAAPQPMPPAQVCNAVTNLGVCYTFNGSRNSEEKPRKGNEFACKLMRGRYLASDSCPVAQAHGKCVVQQGQPGEYALFYYQGGKFSRAQAESDCRNPKSSIHAQGAGVWTAF